MIPTRVSVQESIREKVRNNISMIQLVMLIIEMYGSANKTDTESNYIYSKESQMCISEENLDTILTVLLTDEGKGMAMAIDTNPEFSSRFTFHYNPIEGEGIISLK